MKPCSTSGCENPVKMTGDKCEDCFAAVSSAAFAGPAIETGAIPRAVGEAAKKAGLKPADVLDYLLRGSSP